MTECLNESKSNPQLSVEGDSLYLSMAVSNTELQKRFGVVSLKTEVRKIDLHSGMVVPQAFRSGFEVEFEPGPDYFFRYQYPHCSLATHGNGLYLHACWDRSVARRIDLRTGTVTTLEDGYRHASFGNPLSLDQCDHCTGYVLVPDKKRNTLYVIESARRHLYD